jgi:hypothetical protein
MVDLSDLYFSKPYAPLEKDISQDLLKRLEKYFLVYREVKGTHWTGKSVRLDAVLQPKESLGFADSNCFLGLELKRGFDGVGEITKQISQAVDYANSDFGQFGRMYVFCFPDPSDGNWSRQTTFFDRLLGQLGVGFLSDRNGLLLRLKGHNLWSEAVGVQERNWTLKRKFGSK